MELRLLVWCKPDQQHTSKQDYEKGDHLQVPEPFNHPATLPGHRNADGLMVEEVANSGTAKVVSLNISV